MEKWKKLVSAFKPGTSGMPNQRLTNELSQSDTVKGKKTDYESF